MPLTVKSVRILACLLVIGLAGAASLGLFIKPAGADVTSAQISEFTVTTRDGSYVMDNPLVAGVNYEVTFKLEIAPGVNDSAILGTDFERTGAQYWQLETDYPGVDPATFQFGQSVASFDAQPGTPTFTLTGFVPEEFTMTILPDPDVPVVEGEEIESGIVLHRPGTVSVTSLSLESGGLIEKRVFEVIDSAIVAYRAALSEKQAQLEEISAASEYKNLVKGIISRAQALADFGYVEEATELLGAIPSSGWAQASESESSSMLAYILVAVFAVIALAAIVILIRARSTVGFLKERADDQAKKLDIIESRILKIGEKSLAGDITQVKDALRSMSGR